MSSKWNDVANIGFATAFIALEAVILFAATASAFASLLDLPLPVIRGAVVAGCLTGLGAAGLFARHAVRHRPAADEVPAATDAGDVA